MNKENYLIQDFKINTILFSFLFFFGDEFLVTPVAAQICSEMRWQRMQKKNLMTIQRSEISGKETSYAVPTTFPMGSYNCSSVVMVEKQMKRQL